MALSRRDFLRTLGLSAVALGVIDQMLPEIYQSAQAFHQFQGRKVALLIGIDRYPNVPSLAGCGQDLRLQRNLLVQRFGFAAQDIVMLRDQEANRENIFTAFQKQLKDLLQPEDLLLVHFSGYGARVPAGDTSVPVIIPADGMVTNQTVSLNTAIALETLAAFMQSLNPAQAILVLDTSFDPVETQGDHHWRSRTYPKAITVELNPSEKATAEQLKRNLAQRQLGQKPIFRLMAAPTGWAAEGQINGVSTGIFTAALMQYLWAFNPQTTAVEAQTFFDAYYLKCYGSTRGEQLQEPKTATPYGMLPINPGVALGNVVAQEGNTLELCLAGMEPELWQAIAPGSEYQTLDPSATLLQVTSKNGLFAQAKTSVIPPPVGTVCTEKKRLLPRNLTLKIALGNHLSRIERVDATSALAGLAGVTSVSNPSEWADYVFDAGYQLFSVTGQAIAGLPVMADNETVKSAVNRLQPYFEQLLALKWLRLLLNETSSQIDLHLSLNRVGKTALPLLEKQIPYAGNTSFTIPTLTLTDDYSYRLSTTGTATLYCLAFAQSPKQELFLLTPQTGLQLTTDQPNFDLKTTLQPPIGLWQQYWLISDRPYTNLQTQLAKRLGELETIPQKLDNPLPLIQALLTDLQDLPAGTTDNKEIYALTTTQWAGLSLSYTLLESPSITT